MRSGRPSTSRNPEIGVDDGDDQGVVHHEYAPEGQTINKQYYLEVLRRLRDAVRRKRPALWATQDWQLHHDKAPAHSAHLVQEFLAKHGITQVRPAPHSPDMAPCDFWLFPQLKMSLKVTRFQDTEGIKTNATMALLAIAKSDFSQCFQQWKGNWAKCVESQGAYFEWEYSSNSVSIRVYCLGTKVGYFLIRHCTSYIFAGFFYA